MVPEHLVGIDREKVIYTTLAATLKRILRLRVNQVFRNFESSWAEQRAYVDDAVKALGTSDFAKEAQKRLKAIVPKMPNKAGYKLVDDTTTVFDTPHFGIGFDPQTGD